MAEKPIRIPPELEDVVTQIGEFIEYWGFKNVHGRIWAHLFLSPEPLDAGDLVDRLGISKALASMSLNELLEYDVIQNVGKSKHATVCYRVNPDVVAVITNILRKRERRMLCRLSAAVGVLRDLPPESRDPIDMCGKRTALLCDMVKSAETTLDRMLQLADVSMSVWSPFKNCGK